MNREHIQKKKHKPYLEVSAGKALPVTQTISGDETQRSAYINPRNNV